ncbi:DUF4181 domain-containing protein [Saccharibacillus sp. O23]|uniref:DUF4181 domain-containing protein n=1 Tax=Saccharibacillus sp. O23 TaxID=2009338 RepID=UPI0015C5C521|nr:DUF4181 domain-containing protein [Saccharibacillus sp. O23]
MSLILVLMVLIVVAHFGLTRLIVNPHDKRRLHDKPLVYWASVIIHIGFLILVYYLRISETDVRTVLWLLLGYLVVYSGVYAFLEWRYIRETRRHIVTLLVACMALITIGVFAMLPASAFLY